MKFCISHHTKWASGDQAFGTSYMTVPEATWPLRLSCLKDIEKDLDKRMANHFPGTSANCVILNIMPLADEL